MVEFFEIRSYKHLEFVLGAANVVLLGGCIILGYCWVLTSSDRASIDVLLDNVLKNKMLALLPLGAICILWAWVATQILRLHDRIHEPLMRKWRAGYDADFVLRALLHNFSVKPEFFERAYAERRLRGKFMQRLFYNFVGDETKTAEGRRLFFYSEMAKYWSLGLLEIYGFVALLAFSGYAWRARAPLPPSTVILLSVLVILARIYSNTVLDTAHEITIEQVLAVRTKHLADLKTELKNVLQEQGMSQSHE